MHEYQTGIPADEPLEIVYYVNDRDELVSVNEAWDKFAAANRGRHLVSQHVLCTSLHDAIEEETTQALYRDIIRLARDGHRMQFCFRCDSPNARRLFEMTVSPFGNDRVEFRSRLKHHEYRPHVELFNPLAARNKDLVRVCSWCKKVFADGRWVEVEKALEILHLFEKSPLPRLTHGICETCAQKVLQVLDRAENHATQS